MDIYSFINSKDIAAHCRDIGHKFTPLEMAFVIYLSDRTMTDKHNAWQWIIDTQPDMEIPRRRNMPHYESLHRFLTDNIALEDKSPEKFYDLEGMWIEVPMPFKRGDIVMEKRTNNDRPFVFDKPYGLPDNPWSTQEHIEKMKNEHWDIINMEVIGYRVTGTGRIVHDSIPALSLDIEYFRGELKDRERTLLAVSNFTKEKPEICEDLLLNSYGVHLRETYLRQMNFDWFKIDDYINDEKPTESAADSNVQVQTEEYTDIYSFIPSSDIAAHCRALKHKFTPWEQAVIIYNSKRPIDERHRAIQRIIDECPDERMDDFSLIVPVPFRKGDILTYRDNARFNEPFVLVSDEWKYAGNKPAGERWFRAEGNVTDTIYSYSMDGEAVYYDFNPALLCIEYYRGELTGRNRTLKAIAAYMKGKISADEMMNEYDQVIVEEQLKGLRENLCFYTDEGLAKAGLKKNRG